jgi:DNA repair photolyase
VVVVKEILCKTILSRSGIYGVDYSVNPYVGCQHACVYCYARFMARGAHRGEEWGSFVDVKINALKLLASELRRKPKGPVLLSSVTDPYQPLEKKYELTRGILQLLAKHQFPTTILTKSNLAVRDIDVMKKIRDCEVGFTITTLDENVKRIFEPWSASVEGRLDALRSFHDAGVETYAFLGPMLPYLSEEGLSELLGRFRKIGVNRILVDRLNLKADNWSSIHRALSEKLPDFLPKFEEVLFGSSGYYERLKLKVSEMCRRLDLKVDFCY